MRRVGVLGLWRQSIGARCRFAAMSRYDFCKDSLVVRGTFKLPARLSITFVATRFLLLFSSNFKTLLINFSTKYVALRKRSWRCCGCIGYWRSYGRLTLFASSTPPPIFMINQWESNDTELDARRFFSMDFHGEFWSCPNSTASDERR